MTSQPANTVKTSFLIISDTHSARLFPSDDSEHAYRSPFPPADVLLHAGDLTNLGYINEYEAIFKMLAAAEAELKIVIAGNHDISLDLEYYESTGRRQFHRNTSEDLDVVRNIWTGEEAKKAGIVYLEEGIRTFTLRNEARFTIYTSPYQPEFCDWAFSYERDEDRFNPASAKNPIPSWPAIDILLTHGPPVGILDMTSRGKKVGCEHLLRAVKRCRPRLHCFGHIHEGWGAKRINWVEEASEELPVEGQKVLNDRCVRADVSEGSGKPLRFGDETLFVNAAIMDVRNKPVNAPWSVDLDLPVMAGE
ncbi:MAG: hypothetical protein LQ343_000403 [Gyalolechia ehrenbergii]|nr:MAG: hypothetical protein LQ343_000403 [Gyalolechia ehrenbergii]